MRQSSNPHRTRGIGGRRVKLKKLDAKEALCAADVAATKIPRSIASAECAARRYFRKARLTRRHECLHPSRLRLLCSRPRNLSPGNSL